MSAWMRGVLAAWLIVGGASTAWSQAPAEKLAEPMKPTPPAATAVAATVNGQPILELQVYRGLMREQPKNWAAARKEILNYLIDNTVVDQYLAQLKIQVDAKELAERFAQIKEEARNSKQDFNEILEKLHLTEAELKQELYAALRWDKFVLQQATDKVLLDYFQKNPAMFDGSQVQARHILIAAKDDAEAQSKIAGIRKAVEDQVTTEIGKLPANSDKLVLEKERTKALLVAFALAADKESTCPSKKQGGDLGWFRRVGDMVEPFARTAFALQLYQMSDPVKSEFGYHLILAVDRKPGREAKFEDVKSIVAETYGERLREAIITSYKPRSKIVIQEAK
jgi:parvulin-like peptidyl-prolyl isomerase